MFGTSHAQLENWVAILTIITFIWGFIHSSIAWANRGWKQAENVEKKLMSDSISGLKASDRIISGRLDEVKEAVGKCVTRDIHDQLQREMNSRLDNVVTTLSNQLREGFAQVNTRIDRLTDGHRQ